jgi:dienelactone hydrolase
VNFVLHWAGLVACLFALGCAKAPQLETPAGDSTQVRFHDRVISLEPYLEGFPYSAFHAIFESNILLYDHQEAGRQLKRVALGEAPPDLADGSVVTDVDWNQRSRWGLQHHAATQSLFFTGDESNDEVLNLFQLSLNDGQLTALTDEPYLYGWSLDPAEQRFALVVRRGTGPYTSCLETMNLDGSDRVQHLCDTPQATLSWSKPSWAPDGSGVILRVNLQGQRNRSNLAWVPLSRPELQIFTDPTATRTFAHSPKGWLDSDRAVFVVDDTGYPQLGIYNRSSGEITWRDPFSRDLDDIVVLTIDERPILLAVFHRPDEDWVVTLDASGEELDRAVISGSATLAGTDPDGQALLTITSASTPFSAERLDIDAQGTLTRTPYFGVSAELAAAIVHCDVEAVTFPTHDLDPETGEPRQIRGFLYTPRDPLEQAAARITAFYGGDNTFRIDNQIFCEAGIATLSPAVRGVRGYGSSFYQLNDGDLGGDEIADLFAAARFLETRGYDPSRIGVFGGSHGGYATMRAMTFPPQTNGLDDSYPFAFGLSHAGFSNILTFYEDCNIPDWVVAEAGDPATDSEKLRDRSPLTHVASLSGPLMLTHGSNDSRVPVRESRQMKAACDAANMQCRYVEIPDQGHRIKGLAHQQHLYGERFAFLEAILYGDDTP